MRYQVLIVLRAAVLSVGLLLPACGGSGGSNADASNADASSAGASGVDSSKRLITLSDAERGLLCNWMVAEAGSYGNPGSCDRTQTGLNAPFITYDDQAACIQDAPDETETNCLATVAQLEACVSQLPACATLSDASSTPACAVLSNC